MNLKLPALAFLTPVLWAQSYTISTFAGGGLPVLPGAAVGTSIGNTQGVAVDINGNTYVSDPILSVVFKVTSGGLITIFAGNGKPGYSGDGGPATSAQMDTPFGLAIDASGNLLIADKKNSKIREVSSSGIITTVAGDGVYGYSGDGGPATQAALAYPEGVSVDASGNVYIADTLNNVIRRVSAAGTITTVAGNNVSGYSGDGGPATSASLYTPTEVSADASGNIYVADYDNSVIRKVSLAGVITTFAGNNGSPGYSGDGGPATSASLSYPQGVAVDIGGNVYIADTYNSVIRKVSVSGVITTIAGNGTYGYLGNGTQATSAELANPGNLAVSSTTGAIYIADSNNFRVREVSASGTIDTVAGSGSDNYGGDGGPASNALLATPSAVAVGSNGSVYLADPGNNRIRQVSPAGVITSIAGNGVSGYVGDNGPATAAELNTPSGLAVDPSGNLFVADTFNSVIRKISPAGIITTVAGTGSFGNSGDGGPALEAKLAYPSAVTLDTAGNLYIADTSNCVIRKVTAAGLITTVAGNGTAGYAGDNGPATAAELQYPYGIAVDGAGNLFIADTFNYVVRVVTTNGVITTVPDIYGLISAPFGVAVDGSGNLFIADSGEQRIAKVAPNGILSTIAGGSYGYSGDGGPATSATMNSPQALSLGPNGFIYVADTGNNVVRALTPCIQSLTSVANADATSPTLSIPLTAASSCSWSASSLPSWITSASSGTGSGNLTLTLQPNTTGADRSAVITVNGLLLTVGQNFTTSTFSDVPPGTYFFDAVNLLKGENVTSGCGATTYCPSAVVTRDDMAIFIVRTILGNGTFNYAPTPHFADVSSTYFGFPWIQKLYELGITSGCGGTPINYCPLETVTRDQMAIFIVRARYGPTTMFTWNPTPYFTDVLSNYYAFDWIQRMYQDSITSGCSVTPLNYCPLSPVTRGDMAIFLMRGGYNQLLPSTSPVITSIAPSTLAHGTTGTFTVTGANTTFQQGLTNLVFPATSGITVNSVTVTSATTMQVNLTASSSAPLAPVSVYEQTEPQEAVLPNGLEIQ